MSNTVKLMKNSLKSHKRMTHQVQSLYGVISFKRLPEIAILVNNSDVEDIK